MFSDFLPKIDKEKCIACELCVRVCPNGVLAMVHHLPVVSNPEVCSYSGHCQEICPTEAISLTYEIIFGEER